MSVARSLLSLILLIAAVAVALAGMGLHWVDRAARTPEPVRRIVGPVTSDDPLIAAIATELETAAIQQIPESADLVRGAHDQLAALITQAIDVALSDDRLNQAWFESVDGTRIRLMNSLDAVRDRGADAPTVWLPLTPFVELGEAKLQELGGPALQPLVAQLQLPDDLAVPLGRLDAGPAQRAANIVGLARDWRWYYAGAAGLAAVGLLAGSRRGRWTALLIASTLGLVGLFLAARATEFLPVPASDSISGAIRARLITGSTASVNAWIDTAMMAGYVTIGVAVLGLIVASVAARRRPDQG